MKFFSTINNVKAMEWGLQINQAYLFSWIYELPSWASSVIIGNDVYYYASKNKAVKELPLLTDKVDTMYRYYKQLEGLGLITLKKIDGHDYISITQKGKQWYYNDKSNGNSDLNDELGFKSESNSDSNPTYNNIIDNKEYIYTQAINTLQVDICFDDFWSIYSGISTEDNNARKKKAEVAWKKLNGDERLQAIAYARKLKEMGRPASFVPTPDKLLRLKEFENEPHLHVQTKGGTFASKNKYGLTEDEMKHFHSMPIEDVIACIEKNELKTIKSFPRYKIACEKIGRIPMNQDFFYSLLA